MKITVEKLVRWWVSAALSILTAVFAGIAVLIMALYLWTIPLLLTAFAVRWYMGSNRKKDLFDKLGQAFLTIITYGLGGAVMLLLFVATFAFHPIITLIGIGVWVMYRRSKNSTAEVA